MSAGDDLAASLPEPPPPNPVRRQAAIGAALDRYDGRPSARPAPARGPRWAWPRLSGPQLGAFASIMLALFVGGPLLWSSLQQDPDYARIRTQPPAATDDGVAPAPARRSTGEAAEGATAPGHEQPEPAEASPAASTKSANAAPAQVPGPPVADLISARERENRSSTMEAVPPPPSAPPAPPPPPPPPVAMAPAESRAATGAELKAMRRAEQAEAADYASAGEIVVTSQRRMARGDWNACTVDDPAPKPNSCRRLANPDSKGSNGQAAARAVDGLSAAWRGDGAAAIAAFGEAIALRPKWSFAYLNRGLAFARQGELDRALADLDRAVRYDPGSARNHYNRSRILRLRGEDRRARADEEKAVSLDDSYAEVVP